MIAFAWPWLFACLPLPLFVRLLWPPAPAAEEAALRVPRLERYEASGSSISAPARRNWAWWLALPAWILLVTAAARPMWYGQPIALNRGGRDLMLAVDLSGSMATKDFTLQGQPVARLDAVKAIAGDFIQHRVGDRIGLILFGTNAYVQAPLSFDRKTVDALLQESAIGLAGDQTAIGDAIGLAIKELKRHPHGNKVLVLLTDGANDAGNVDPQTAATLAAKAGMTIYTIGVGADSMSVPGFFGTQQVNPSQDLDEPALRAIARTTHGRYFRATDTTKLNQIYRIIDRLQPVDQTQETYRPQHSLFAWPLGFALLLSAPLVWRRRRA